MNHLTDQELIAQARTGNDAAFEVLMRRHLQPIFRFILRLSGDAAVAQDLAQETFIKVWKNLKKFNPAKSFKVWLFTIAKNTTFDWFKKRRALPFSTLEDEEGTSPLENLADQTPLPDELFQKRETHTALTVALNNLQPKARAVVLLHQIEDMTFQEIADALDEPLNTIKSRYLRTIANLRKALFEGLK
jgi:RNA polymerase sigma-70 factor (ECF subfamily)